VEHEKRIAELERQVAERDAIIEALTERLKQLERTVAELSERLNRNSNNSHLPPSSDGPGGRQGKKGQEVSLRKRGGQKGHRGNHRKLLPPDEVDHIVNHYPSECDDCGARLPEVEDPDAVRTQVTEVPPVRPTVTEHRCHAVACPCGCISRARPGSLPTSSFGPRLMSLIALFTGVYHLSRRQTVQVLEDVLGAEISLGGLSSVEARVSEAVEAPANEVWEYVDHAAVKHADATSWLHQGVSRSLWTIATATATAFKILVDGSAAVIKPFFGSCTGILVSDRATVFSFWSMKRRQICWAHLIRKFISFSERDGPAGPVGGELLKYAKLLFEYWDNFRDGKLTRKKLIEWTAPLRNQVESCLERATNAGIEHVSGSCADILAHREALWTFLDRNNVEPTNNHAERELRAFVLWRKRCFGAQSERGHQFAERVMTVAHTARKQNKNVLAFLTACCEAQLSGSGTPSLFAPDVLAAVRAA